MTSDDDAQQPQRRTSSVTSSAADSAPLVASPRGCSVSSAAADAHSNGDVTRQPKKRARISPNSTGVLSSSARTDAEPPLSLFRVGCLKERHASWRDLTAYLAFYMHATQTRIATSAIVSLSQQNAAMRAGRETAALATETQPCAGSGSIRRLFPESSEAYSRTFECRGLQQQSDDDCSQSQRDSVAAGACPFRFVAQVVRDSDAWRVLVPLASQHCVHNHSVVGGLRVPRAEATPSRASDRTQQRATEDAAIGASVEDQPALRDGDDRSQENAQQSVGSEPETGERSTAGVEARALELDAQLPPPGVPSTPTRLAQLPTQWNRPLQEYYESWEEFLNYVDEYAYVTCSKLIHQKGVAVDMHNHNMLLESTRRATMQARSVGNEHVELVPEEWKVVSRQLRCQSSREGDARRCTFHLRARVVKAKGVWRVHLPVHKQNATHNHPLRTLFSLSSRENAEQSAAVAAPSMISNPPWQAPGEGHRQQYRANGSTALLPFPETRLKEFHDSWDDFFAYLSVYAHSAKPNSIVIRNTTSISARNQEILESGHFGFLLPEWLKAFAYEFGCSPGEPSRSDIECPFRFTAHVIRANDVWRIRVPLLLQRCAHDHEGTRAAAETEANLQPPATARRNRNLLDIRLIPRDHPLYDAICELARSQHLDLDQEELQRQQRTMHSTRDPAPSVPIHPTGLLDEPSASASDVHSGKKHEVRAGTHDKEGVKETKDSGDRGGERATENPTATQDSNTISSSSNGSNESQEVRVASVQEFHASWESLSMYLHEYMRETKTKIVISGSVSVSKRNKQMLKKQQAQRRSSGVCLIPDELKVYHRRYICTHGSEKRNRSQGLRQTRHLRATGCKFQFSAHVAQLDSVWCVHVPLNSQCCVHNHPVEQEQFENYSSHRAIPKLHPLYDEVRRMVLAGSDKTAEIFEFIRASSSFKVTKKDVRNMIQAIKRS